MKFFVFASFEFKWKVSAQRRISYFKILVIIEKKKVFIQYLFISAVWLILIGLPLPFDLLDWIESGS